MEIYLVWRDNGNNIDFINAHTTLDGAKEEIDWEIKNNFSQEEMYEDPKLYWESLDGSKGLWIQTTKLLN